MPLYEMYPDIPLRFIGIDGGTSTVGLCYFGIEDKKMVVYDHHLIDVSKRNHQYEYINDLYGDLSSRLEQIADQFDEYLRSRPITVAHVFYESHFFMMKRPTSIIPLARSMQKIEDVLLHHGIQITHIAPQQMKKTINVEGKLSSANKTNVLNAIQKLIVHGSIQTKSQLSLLSEHEVDAVGIGYTGVRLAKLIPAI